MNQSKSIHNSSQNSHKRKFGIEENPIYYLEDDIEIGSKKETEKNILIWDVLLNIYTPFIEGKRCGIYFGVLDKEYNFVIYGPYVLHDEELYKKLGEYGFDICSDLSNIDLCESLFLSHMYISKYREVWRYKNKITNV
jgi:hypothetical protein